MEKVILCLFRLHRVLNQMNSVLDGLSWSLKAAKDLARSLI